MRILDSIDVGERECPARPEATGQTDPAISVRDLRKFYKPQGDRRKSAQQVKAVNGISLDIAPGEFFGLLGPNGAGKTTTVGILTTRVRPTSGTARIFGIDVARNPVAVKRHIGVVPQSNNLDRSLTALENLLFHAEYFGIAKVVRERRAQELLQQFCLEERANDRPGTYSGGMAQRLKIARALMHDPAILFLDEPSTGLDPQSRRMIWDLLTELNERGQTIFLTTHYMEEADQLCSRIAIMDHGKLLALDSPSRLKAKVPGGYLIELQVKNENDESQKLQTTLNSLPGVVEVNAHNGHIRMYADKLEGMLAHVMKLATDVGIMVTDAHVAEPSLENLFLHLTGRRLRE